ncbi:MAG: GNAT family N-acetyltransferase [Bacteroidia bacterium]
MKALTEAGIEIRPIHARETYPLRHRVMWPKKPLDFIMLENDDEGVHFGLFKDASITSVVSIFIDGNDAQFRKFATKTSEQGNGYGSLLLRHVLAYISTKRKVEKVWCNARVDKTSFYERFGMTQTSERFTKAGIHYVIMEKV